MMCLAPGAPISAADVEGSPLIIEVNGVPSSKGAVRADVCTITTFLKTNCPYSGVARAVEGETTVTVDNVPPGIYAVQLFHDRDNTGRLARGVLGIPKESIGFSNDAPLGLHGPKFAHAAFTHGQGPQTITVTLRLFGPGPHQPTPSQITVE
jgi:uncharacterized protein (DUF2141 family)